MQSFYHPNGQKLRQIAVSPYSFYKGRGSLNAIQDLAKLFNLGVDYGQWNEPMTFLSTDRLSDADYAVFVEMLEDGFNSPTGYAGVE